MNFAGSSLQKRTKAKGGAAGRGFTLIECIGALAVIALLASIVIPMIIRRVDQAAMTREAADLDEIASALTQYAVRNKSLPGPIAWATNIASEMSLPVRAISTTARGYTRAFVIDTNLSIGGSSLPYPQSAAGATAKPANARLMIVSSLTRNLPVTSGVFGPSAFDPIWNASEGSVPSGSTWTGWSQNDDLHIKRVNLEPLFYQLILVNRDTNTPPPKYRIDTFATNSVPTGGLGTNSYYLDGTVVGLYDTNSLLISRYLMKRSASFVFEGGAWRAQILGPTNVNSQATNGDGSTTFASSAAAFFATNWNFRTDTGGGQGSSQSAVLSSMYSFMSTYTLWAGWNPHFSSFGQSGGQVNSLPIYELLTGSAASLNQYSGTANDGLLFK